MKAYFLTMDSSDVVAILVGLGIAGGLVYAYEKGYIKVPTVSTPTSSPSNNTTTSSTTTSSTTTSSTTTSSTTTSSTTTSNSQPGTITGTAYSGNGSSVSTNTFTSSSPSSNGSSSSSTSSTSNNSSSSSSSNNNSSTVPTNSSGGGSYPSSSGGTGNVAPPSGNCSTPCSCPQGISGNCYCPNCNCFSLNNVTINNNYNTSVQIEIASEYVSYCNMTQGITWISGTIQPGQFNDPLPVAPNSNVGGAIYVYPPNGANNNYPFVLDYQFVNGSNIVIVPEVDLAPTMTVTITNNTQYDIVLSNVSNLFNNQKVTIAPGQSGSISVGNGWMFAVGTVDPFENFPNNNPAPVQCFNQFVMVNGQPAINYINDKDYNTCSSYQYMLTVNGNTYSGNMGNGLNYNVQTVNTSGGSNNSSSSSNNNSANNTSSNVNSNNTSSQNGYTLHGGIRPRIVPY